MWRWMALVLLAGLPLPAAAQATASATEDRVPRVAIVPSDFRGSQDHDGAVISGLASPKPLTAALTKTDIDAMLAKALELGNTRRGGLDRIIRPGDWVVLLAGPGADPRLVAAVADWLAANGKQERVSLIGLDSGALSGHRKEAALKMEPAALTDSMRMPAPGIYSRRDVDYQVARALLHCDKVVTVAALPRGPRLPSIEAFGAAAKGPHATDPATQLDLFSFHPAEYSIVGSLGPVNMIVAGPFPTSVDAVVYKLRGGEPAQNPVLREAERRGFGDGDTDYIWLRGLEIEDAMKLLPAPRKVATMEVKR
ncbi:MAG: hypothetical protein IPM24_21725 [Bryobacterales bacterium]|nr:hypothetical protein [Bryobacterales bacterium]